MALDDAECSRAIANLARLTRGALYLGVLTDDEHLYDRARTDPRQHRRPAAWYRRRLARHFVAAGGGVFLRRDTEVVIWALERG